MMKNDTYLLLVELDTKTTNKTAQPKADKYFHR